MSSTQSITRTRNLTCCCCGGSAPAKEQWWNRDTGFGLCGSCAERIQKRSDYDPDEFKSCYGIEGVHWFALSGRLPCAESTFCPDDSIRACVLPSGHDGFHDGGVR